MKRWYENDKLHREDGPALEYDDGTKIWFLNGKYHRENGPAIEYADGSERWCLDNEILGFKKPENWNDLVNMIRCRNNHGNLNEERTY